RCVPRKFGRVLEGDIAACKQIAQSYGIGLDPIYSLAAWEMACRQATVDASSSSFSSSGSSCTSSFSASSSSYSNLPPSTADSEGCEVRCSSGHVAMSTAGGTDPRVTKVSPANLTAT
ncbi:hypothetical protein Agub_g321, partial [Astrephomene gubernaculifera]